MDNTTSFNIKKIWLLFINSVRMHVILLGVITVYILISVFVADLFDVGSQTSITLYTQELGILSSCFIICFFCGHALYVTFRIRPKRLFEHYFNDLRDNYFSGQRFFTAAPVLLFFPLFFSAFTSFKNILPVINPYSWDQPLAQMDAIMHGGIMPWQWLHTIVGSPIITSGINFFYQLWFFVMYAIFFWQAFSLRTPLLRMRFLLSFIGIWILFGTVCAIGLSSAGPCYYGRITGLNDPFQPLLQYLNTTNNTFPILALDVQEHLWKTYTTKAIGLGGGISAMPSMHVATSTLFTLLGWRSSRALGIILTLFLVIIMIGSVHLGWHYAIDGYVAIIGTWLVWLGTGWVLNRHPKLIE
ncbi:MAG: hypothetical protein BA874_07790 [Desulfuromonadales bacterium C00003068]|nr:MAG: hypothetical protein BA874_07790 [Desulfuromonadales bacterium C00003068]